MGVKNYYPTPDYKNYCSPDLTLNINNPHSLEILGKNKDSNIFNAQINRLPNINENVNRYPAERDPKELTGFDRLKSEVLNYANQVQPDDIISRKTGNLRSSVDAMDKKISFSSVSPYIN